MIHRVNIELPVSTNLAHTISRPQDLCRRRCGRDQVGADRRQQPECTDDRAIAKGATASPSQASRSSSTFSTVSLLSLITLLPMTFEARSPPHAPKPSGVTVNRRALCILSTAPFQQYRQL